MSEPVVLDLYCVFARPCRIALARASTFSASAARLVLRSTFAYSSSALAKLTGSAARGAFSKIEIACLQQISASSFLPCAQQAWAIFAQHRATCGWLAPSVDS